MKNLTVNLMFDPNMSIEEKIKHIRNVQWYRANSCKEFIEQRHYLKYTPLSLIQQKEYRGVAMIILNNVILDALYDKDKKPMYTDEEGNPRIEDATDAFQVFKITDLTATIYAVWNKKYARTSFEIMNRWHGLNYGDSVSQINFLYILSKDTPVIFDVIKNPPANNMKTLEDEIKNQFGFLEPLRV